MSNLRSALQAFLDNWQQDCHSAWLPLIGTAEPDFNAVPAAFTLAAGERVFPLRKDHADAEAPAGSHLLKALDGLKPEQVRAVLLGQDPYPEISQATGRAFEQGDLSSWRGKVSKSLRRVVPVLAQHRSLLPGQLTSDSQWPAIQDALAQGQLPLPEPKALFDHWEQQGVLCLNTGLTLSRFDKKGTPANAQVQPAHMALWQPVVGALLRALACRSSGVLLVMLWGKKAEEAFAAMRVEAAAMSAGQAQRLLKVTHPHPAAPAPEGAPELVPFFQSPNPFDTANAALGQAEQASIAW